MCQAVACSQCGKTTWTGCGQHVDQVMKNVPRAKQCPGHEPVPSKSLFSRIFSR